MNGKQTMRAQLGRQRNSLKPDWIAARSAEVQARVMALAEFLGAETVLAYWAMAGEPLTLGLLEHCWKHGVRTCLPAFVEANRSYGLAALHAQTRLVAGPLGIPQPEGEANVALDDVSLALVPGLGFDRTGARLGHGGGHYDRLLDTAGRRPFRVGVGFDFALTERVPVEEHDVRMDAVITPGWTIRCV